MLPIVDAIAALPVDDATLAAAVARWIGSGEPGILSQVVGEATPDPWWCGAVHAARRRRDDPEGAALHGVVYTPPEAAHALAAATLAQVPGLPVVLDPACGGGALLLAAAAILWARAQAVTPAHRLAVVRSHLRGTDLDPVAVSTARTALALAAGSPGASLDDAITVGDALAGPAGPPVDVVLANPPWVDSERMSTHAPARRQALTARFATATGNWDLFCPFVERCAQRAPHGVLGLLLPDKVASVPYATAVRRLLHGARRVAAVLDLRDVGLGVDAHAIGLVVVPGPADDSLPTDGSPWPVLGGDDDGPILAALARWPRLDEVAVVTGAATVAEAYAWQEHLRSGQPDADHAPVLNSGTIDPWQGAWASKPMRYLGRTVACPVLPLHVLSDRRRAHARQPKLIVAGLTRTLEAFVDEDGGWVGAKSTALILPHDPADCAWLGAWLHSALASRHYRATWGGLALSGGYLRVGPRQLAALPIPPPGPHRDALAALGRERAADPDDGAVAAQVDALLDHLLRATSTGAG